MLESSKKKKDAQFFDQWMYHSNYGDDEKEMLLPWFIGRSILLGHAWAVFSFIFIFSFVILYQLSLSPGGGHPTPVFLPGESSWIEEPGKLQSMGLQRVGHDWATKHSTAQTERASLLSEMPFKTSNTTSSHISPQHPHHHHQTPSLLPWVLKGKLFHPDFWVSKKSYWYQVQA